MNFIRAVSAGLILLQAWTGHAQDDVITGFSGNGFLTWTNSHSNGMFNVEWASSPEGPWQARWDSLWNIAATSGTLSASVPMFYRVTWSTNETHELHISPAETTIGYDGNLVVLTAAGGDGSYQWDVYDPYYGNLVGPSTGTTVLYIRANHGDNAAIVHSTGLTAYAIIHQP